MRIDNGIYNFYTWDKQQNHLNIFSVAVKAGAFCTMDKRGKIACVSLINQFEIDMIDVETNQCSLLNSTEFSKLWDEFKV